MVIAWRASGRPGAGTTAQLTEHRAAQLWVERTPFLRAVPHLISAEHGELTPLQPAEVAEILHHPITATEALALPQATVAPDLAWGHISVGQWQQAWTITDANLFSRLAQMQAEDAAITLATAAEFVRWRECEPTKPEIALHILTAITTQTALPVTWS